MKESKVRSSRHANRKSFFLLTGIAILFPFFACKTVSNRISEDKLDCGSRILETNQYVKVIDYDGSEILNSENIEAFLINGEEKSAVEVTPKACLSFPKSLRKAGTKLLVSWIDTKVSQGAIIELSEGKNQIRLEKIQEESSNFNCSETLYLKNFEEYFHELTKNRQDRFKVSIKDLDTQKIIYDSEYVEYNEIPVEDRYGVEIRFLDKLLNKSKVNICNVIIDRSPPQIILSDIKKKMENEYYIQKDVFLFIKIQDQSPSKFYYCKAIKDPCEWVEEIYTISPNDYLNTPLNFKSIDRAGNTSELKNQRFTNNPTKTGALR